MSLNVLTQCDALVTLWSPATLTQSQVICFSLVLLRSMSALWPSHILKYLNCEWRTALTTQHLPPANRTSLRVSSRCSSEKAKRCDRKPSTEAISLLMLCCTFISYCAPFANPLGSWNAYSSHDGTMHSLNNEYVHRIHSFCTLRRSIHCCPCPILCFRVNTGYIFTVLLKK